MKTDFNDLKSTIKGNYGEHIIVPVLKAKGYTVYKVDEDNKPHTHDYYITRWRRGKLQQFAVEVKTKSSLLYYDAIGIDNNKLEKYIEINKAVKLIFITIDDVTGTIEWSLLDTLLAPIEVFDTKKKQIISYPNSDLLAKNKSTLVWKNNMKVLGLLKDNDIDNIRKLTNVSPDYYNKYYN